MVEGVVRAGRFRWQHQRAAAQPYLLTPYEPYLLTPYGWWLRAQVSRDAPPPLPGGYTVGDKVFFTGTSKTFASGNKLVHGQQGEVTGPATLEGYISKGVRVLFPGNKDSINCYLTSVRRLRAASAAAAPPAPHKRDLPTPRVFPRQPLPRRPSPHCTSSRAVAPRPAPECGEGVLVRASGF